MPSPLQKFLNFSETKFVSVYETILLCNPYSEKIILYVFIRLSVLQPSTCFMTGTLEW